MSAFLAFAGNAAGAEAAIFAHPQPGTGSAANMTPLVVYGSSYLRGTRFLGYPRNAAFEVQAVTRMRNAAGLNAYAIAASDPKSVYYRKFLTPKQIADNFGTPAADYANAVAYLRSYGLRVQTYKQREMLRVWGSQSALERAFGTRFGIFRRGSARLAAPVSTPRVPNGVHIDALAGAVTGLHLMHIDSMPGGPPSAYSSGRIAGYSPFQIASAFDYSGAYEAGYTGKGVTLGIIGTGPVTPLEINEYHKIFNVPVTGTFTIVPGVANTAYGDSAGDTTPPPPTDNEFNPCTQPASGTNYAVCNPEDGEAQLDAEQQTSLAPGANVRNYLAYNANETTCNTPPIVTPIGTVPPNCTGSSTLGAAGPEIGLDLYEDELQAEIDENLADAISLSFGSCDTLEEAEQNPNATGDGFDHNEYASIVAEGTAIFVSSGDSGPEGCAGGLVDVPNASSPADDPNIVAVGGTNTPIDSNGKLEGPLTLWGAQTQDGSSGVGPSSIYTAPAYQTGAGLGNTCIFRCIPDVDLEGDPTTGVADLEYPAPGKGADVPIGGTSVSAPEMAAMWGLVLQACKQTPSCGTGGSNGAGSASPSYRLGNPDPLLYALYTNKPKYAEAFDDIVYGTSEIPTEAQTELQAEGGPNAYSTGVFAPGAQSAGPGFDEASGLGAPFGRGLIRAIVGV
jgi:subtilase family serine protease